MTANVREASNPVFIAELIADLRDQPGPLLNVLHRVHETFGHIPAAAVPLVADQLNLSRADVHGVVSFYHYFRTSPPGRHVVRMCRAEACQSMQGQALEVHARETLGVKEHGTTTDEAFTLEPVYCLGLCALSPAVMIDDDVYGRVTPARLDELLAEWRNR